MVIMLRVSLLQSIFSVPLVPLSSTVPSSGVGSRGDFAIKSLRPYQDFKDGCEESFIMNFYENNVTKRNKSTGQDYIRWFEPFVNVAMKRYTV